MKAARLRCRTHPGFQTTSKQTLDLWNQVLQTECFGNRRDRTGHTNGDTDAWTWHGSTDSGNKAYYPGYCPTYYPIYPIKSPVILHPGLFGFTVLGFIFENHLSLLRVGVNDMEGLVGHEVGRVRGLVALVRALCFPVPFFPASLTVSSGDPQKEVALSVALAVHVVLAIALWFPFSRSRPEPSGLFAVQNLGPGLLVTHQRVVEVRHILEDIFQILFESHHVQGVCIALSCQHFNVFLVNFFFFCIVCWTHPTSIGLVFHGHKAWLRLHSWSGRPFSSHPMTPKWTLPGSSWIFRSSWCRCRRWSWSKLASCPQDWGHSVSKAGMRGTLSSSLHPTHPWRPGACSRSSCWIHRFSEQFCRLLVQTARMSSSLWTPPTLTTPLEGSSHRSLGRWAPLTANFWPVPRLYLCRAWLTVVLTSVGLSLGICCQWTWPSLCTLSHCQLQDRRWAAGSICGCPCLLTLLQLTWRRNQAFHEICGPSGLRYQCDFVEDHKGRESSNSFGGFQGSPKPQPVPLTGPDRPPGPLVTLLDLRGWPQRVSALRLFAPRGPWAMSSGSMQRWRLECLCKRKWSSKVGYLKWKKSHIAIYIYVYIKNATDTTVIYCALGRPQVQFVSDIRVQNWLRWMLTWHKHCMHYTSLDIIEWASAQVPPTPL